MRIFVTLMCLHFLSFACKSTPEKKALGHSQELTDEYYCNEQEAYIWILLSDDQGGECVSIGGKKHQQFKCKEKKWKWIGSNCYSPEEFNSSKENCIGKKGNWDEQKGDCTEKLAISSNKEECEEKGFVYFQGTCFSGSAEECLSIGGIVSANGKCLSPLASDCENKQDGSRWVAGHCASSDEQKCLASSPDARWYKDKTWCGYKSFKEYCEDKDKSASDSIKITISRIKSALLSFDASCEDIEIKLKKAETLSLMGKDGYEKITNLKPLMHYSNLKSLNLADNTIEEISSLYPLENLQYLDLSSNRIKNLSGISKLIKLKQLRLKNNNIESVIELTNLRELEKLDLGNNNIQDINKLGVAGVYLVKVHTLLLANNCGIKGEDIKGLFNNLSAPRIVNLNRTSVDLSHIPKLYRRDFANRDKGKISVVRLDGSPDWCKNKSWVFEEGKGKWSDKSKAN